MAKNYLGTTGTKKLMGIILGAFPSNEINEDETKQLWDSLDEPVIEVAPDGELSNWNYTLDETNGTVTLNQYTNTTETDVTVYGKYQLNGKVYDTKIGSNDSGSIYYMFHGKSNIQMITFKEGIDTSDVTSMDNMFNQCDALTTINGLEYFDTSNVTDMQHMFYRCLALTSLDLTGWNTSNVTNMANMFYSCTALTSLDLRGWDTSNVTTMYRMFTDCYALTKILVTSGKWVIGEGCNTRYMFNGCGVSTVTYA